MSYFDQYSGIAGQIADKWGIPRSLFFGDIQVESGWNPYAVGDHGAAIGFGQLHAGAASDVGFDRYNPVQNLEGTAAYIKRQYNRYGNWTDAFAAYNQGHLNDAGLGYSAKVMKAAKSFGDSVMPSGSGGVSDMLKGLDKSVTDIMANGIDAGVNAIIPGLGTFDKTFLNTSGTADWFTEFKDWITNSGFFERLALGVLALLFVLGGLYLLKGKSL